MWPNIVITQAGDNGDTFLEKDILHFGGNHRIKVVNLLHCPWNLAVIIMAGIITRP